MRLSRRSLAAIAVSCCVLSACGSDDTPSAVEASSTIAQARADTSVEGSDATLPAGAGGDTDCAALKDSLASMIVNWQVVIGLTNLPVSEWAQIPLGTIPKFGDQLAVTTAALNSDADAAAALSFMSGANDIVQRGIGGDAAAQTDLNAYMGSDVTANISKQIPISIAYQNAGCD